MNVFTGPTSPLYGNFALAGVVNVRTLERMTGHVRLALGRLVRQVEGSVLAGFDHDLGRSIRAPRIREDGWRPNSGYQLGQGHARVVRNLSGTATLDAGMELYAAGWDSPGFITAEQFELRSGSTPLPTYRRRVQASRAGTGEPARRSLSGLVWRSTVYATQGRWQLFLTTPPEGGSEEGIRQPDRGRGPALRFRRHDGGDQDDRADRRSRSGAEGRFEHANYENWLTTDRGSRRGAGRRDRPAALGRAVPPERHRRHFTQLRVDVGGRYDVVGTRSHPGRRHGRSATARESSFRSSARCTASGRHSTSMPMSRAGSARPMT